MMNTTLLEDAALRDQLLRNCSLQRRDKMIGICSEQERRSRLAGSALLDLALRQTGCREQDAVYAFEDGGKPRIPALPGFHFSISHSGDTVILAVSDHPVGADVQQPRIVSVALQKRYFTQRELAASDPIRLWALKESYGKLTGEGIAVLGKTELLLEDRVLLLRDGIPQQVVFYETVLKNGSYVATCCYENPSLAIEMIEVNRSDLI